MTETERLFPPDFMQRLERLQLTCRQVFHSLAGGQRTGLRKGSGQEFVDRREYAPGDDFRHIDWAVLARRGDLLIRRFLEDTQTDVQLLVDQSASMSAGDPSKWDLARQVVGGLATLALRTFDEVHVRAFGCTLSTPFRIDSPARAGRLFSFLGELPLTHGRGDLDAVTRTLLASPKQAGLLLMVSDFFFPAGITGALQRLRQAGYEVQLLQITTPEEAEPALGHFRLVDLETDEPRQVHVDATRQAAYQKLFQNFLERTRREAYEHSCPLTHVTNEVPYDAAIVQWLAAGQLASP